MKVREELIALLFEKGRTEACESQLSIAERVHAHFYYGYFLTCIQEALSLADSTALHQMKRTLAMQAVVSGKLDIAEQRYASIELEVSDYYGTN